jgi:hypothetical protein
MKSIFIFIILINSFSIFCQIKKMENEKLIYQTLIDDIRYKKEKNFVIQRETSSYYLQTIKGADIFRDTLYMYEVETYSKKKLDTFWRRLLIDTSWRQDILNISELDSSETNLPEIEKYSPIYISSDSLNSIFDPDKNGGWSSFHKLFPKAKGLLVFSKIAYSKNNKRAIVYLSRTGGYTSGEGLIYFLSNENGIWKIVHKEGMWVS